MEIGRLRRHDYYRGYLQLLEQLTTVNADKISFGDFCKQLGGINSNIFVMRDKNVDDKVIATGTIYIERKFIHNLGKVGHIEDVVVDSNYRGQGLGKKMINILVDRAKKEKCYKVILDCSEKNVGFYEKCGFVKHEVEMRMYLDQ